MTECAICHGESGEEPSDGFKVCDICLGKKSLPPGHHLYQEKEEAVEDQAIMEITPVGKVATCPNCKRELALCTDNWYADRSRKNGFKRLCKDCQRKKDTEAHARMREAKAKVLAKAAQIVAGSKPMLPIVPSELRIVMGDTGDFLSVTVLSDTGGKYLCVEPDSSSEGYSLNEPHFYIRTEDQIDRLAETLRAILRQVKATR